MRIWVICLLWISLATSAVAQYFNPVYQQGQVTVKSNRVELRGKSLKLDFSVEFIFTGRRITDRDTNLAKKVKGVVQVVPSIGSPRHIGGV